MISCGVASARRALTSVQSSKASASTADMTPVNSSQRVYERALIGSSLDGHYPPILPEDRWATRIKRPVSYTLPRRERPRFSPTQEQGNLTYLADQSQDSGETRF